MSPQQKTVPVSSARAWTVATLLFTAGFINYLDRAIVSVALPVIAVTLHLGPTSKGVLLSAFFWSYALMQLPAGWAADRFNLRWFYSAAFALWSLACGFTGLASTLGVLMMMRVILGIGESIYLPGGMKIISMLFGPKDRGLAAGLMNCGTRAGLALGAPFIAYIVHAYGWQKSFFILGFGSIFWLVPWLAIIPKGMKSSSTKQQPSLARTWASLDRNLLGLCLGHIGYSYYWYLFVTWLPDYLVESRHMTLQHAGEATAVPFLVFAISEPLGGWIADRLTAIGWSERRSRKAVITFAFLTSVMLLVAGRTADDTTAVLLLGSASFVGLATGNLFALLASVAPEGEVGMWMGILNFAGNLSGVVAPIVTGVLIARTGGHYAGFIVAVVILLMGLPAYWWMVGARKQGTPEVAPGT
jgi:ACS family D-galactonate transporter-like MFS transporter